VNRSRTASVRRRRGPNEGATAVEFAMVAGPLFLIIMASIELAMVFIVSTMLESAVSKASREIRTGQQQSGADVTEAAFETKICDSIVLMNGCTERLVVDVRRSGSFTTAGAPNPVSNKTFDDSQLTFDPGGPSEIILVRAFYKWPLFTPFLSQALAKLNGNTALIVSADTFRNEPF
jgi:Flp pilus assembly protein TadG